VSDADPPQSSSAGWSAAPEDAEARRLLLGRRIAYFGAVFFYLSLAFYIRNVALIAIAERTWPPFGHPALVLHVAAIGLSGLQWLLCRSGRRSMGQLGLIDACGLLGSMALYCALVFAETMSREHAIAVHSAGAEVLLVALIMVALIVTHAVIVPADSSRAFRLSAATSSLGPITAYAITAHAFPTELLRANPWLPLSEAGYVAMWAGLTVTVATIAARVIHGLKERVRDANEVGQYRLIEKIGEGGMGIVYLARHALLRRGTAVKLLHPARSGESALRRFEQEVQITSALTHPNTISIFDFGRTPDGVFYYAMEYLDGITLEDLVAHTGPQQPARVAQILRQACGSLDEAHFAGLIHRDIKPANLMLCLRGRVPDFVKVLDFGLVKEHTDEVGMGLSRAGALLGTPAYLAPEAILEPSKIDARADLYALGAVGYYLLVGAPVFEGASMIEVCVKHLSSAPVPPSERTSLPVPASLERLILRCLAKDPSARPASAAEMIVALEELDDLGDWSVKDAGDWWKNTAPGVRGAVKAARSAGSTPGPRTIAVDLAARDSRPAGAQRAH
jgi:eukaryotic-like serine/threonine-protein kinase